MALVIEDGSGKADADSFATAAELAQFATDYGFTIPAGTADQEALLRRASLKRLDAEHQAGAVQEQGPTGDSAAVLSARLLELELEGRVARLHWTRAPRHAPEVVAEIERTVRAAAPYPTPSRLGKVTYVDTWLWDKSGNFQLDTLTEGQL